MPTAYVDASDGVTGDMWLGALIDAGASLQVVQRAVDTLGLGGVRVTFARVPRNGSTACLVRVRAPRYAPAVSRWPEIERVLQFAALDEPVRERAIRTLRRVARAEAALNGRSDDNAEFHELTAITMLADVIGACAAIAHLGLERLHVGPVATGHGTLETVNGELPLPDPNVLTVLDGYDTCEGPLPNTELTSPVGAALVAEFCEPAGEPANGPDRRGIGAGAHGTRLVLELAG